MKFSLHIFLENLISIFTGELALVLLTYEKLAEFGYLSLRTFTLAIIAAAGGLFGKWLFKKLTK